MSWKPDPEAFHTNAFTLSWTEGLHYAFPPFSIIGRVLKKIQEDKATFLVILQLLPIQTWFPRALQLLVEEPVVLPQQCISLPHDPTLVHPLSNKLRLAAMVFQGISSEVPGVLPESWRNGTKQQYGPHIKRWLLFCINGGFNPFQPPVNVLLEFLYREFKSVKGRQYSSMNSIRSAISSVAFIDAKPQANLYWFVDL